MHIALASSNTMHGLERRAVQARQVQLLARQFGSNRQGCGHALSSTKRRS
jgi:hypothetical protein